MRDRPATLFYGECVPLLIFISDGGPYVYLPEHGPDRVLVQPGQFQAGYALSFEIFFRTAGPYFPGGSSSGCRSGYVVSSQEFVGLQCFHPRGVLGLRILLLPADPGKGVEKNNILFPGDIPHFLGDDGDIAIRPDPMERLCADGG